MRAFKTVNFHWLLVSGSDAPCFDGWVREAVNHRTNMKKETRQKLVKIIAHGKGHNLKAYERFESY